MNALIFGSSGQDGFYLEKLLVERGVQVATSSRVKGSVIGDVADYQFVESVIKSHKPKYIFHLAARSSTSHDAVFENHAAITCGGANILEAARLTSPNSRIFLSGSAMQFKNQGLPIDEMTEFEASSPYSVARIHSIYNARYYRAAFGMKIFCGYFFNHDSPLRTENHINQKIALFAKGLLKNESQKLEIGSLEVEKEFNFAGDMMEAVWILVNQDQHFEAVIGSGKSHSIREWVQCCFQAVGKKWEDYIEVDPSYAPEYSRLISNPKLITGLGWRPKYDIHSLATLMMNEQ